MLKLIIRRRSLLYNYDSIDCEECDDKIKCNPTHPLLGYRGMISGHFLKTYKFLGRVPPLGWPVIRDECISDTLVE